MSVSTDWLTARSVAENDAGELPDLTPQFENNVQEIHLDGADCYIILNGVEVELEAGSEAADVETAIVDAEAVPSADDIIVTGVSDDVFKVEFTGFYAGYPQVPIQIRPVVAHTAFPVVKTLQQGGKPILFRPDTYGVIDCSGWDEVEIMAEGQGELATASFGLYWYYPDSGTWRSAESFTLDNDVAEAQARRFNSFGPRYPVQGKQLFIKATGISGLAEDDDENAIPIRLLYRLHRGRSMSVYATE